MYIPALKWESTYLQEGIKDISPENKGKKGGTTAEEGRWGQRDLLNILGILAFIPNATGRSKGI